MYRIFYLGWSGRLYQLGHDGWVLRDGASFATVQDVRDFLKLQVVPHPAGENDCADCYIGAVDAEGQIIMTFPLFTQPA